MAAGIVGKALIVAWSFTLTSLGPAPQIINLGPAPTDSNYVPFFMTLRNINAKDAVGLQMSMGTDYKNPINVLNYPDMVSESMNQNLNGYFPYGMGGNSIVPADQNLYVEYSLPHAYPTTDKPIAVDVLAYPTN